MHYYILWGTRIASLISLNFVSRVFLRINPKSTLKAGKRRGGRAQNSLVAMIKTGKVAAFRASLTRKMNALFIHPFLDLCFSA